MHRRALWFAILLLVVAILGRLDTTDIPIYTTEHRPAPDTQETIVVRRHNFTGEQQVWRYGLPIPRTDSAPER